MSKDGTGSLRTLLGKVGGKVRNSSKDLEATKDQKEHRRAQVRKAQKEHREREQNYIKHLEQDVIRLRGVITAVEAECASSIVENATIKAFLYNRPVVDNLSINALQPTDTTLAKPTVGAMPSARYTSASDSNNYHTPQSLTLSPGHFSAHTASVNFDQGLNAYCLYVSPDSISSTATGAAPEDLSHPTIESTSSAQLTNLKQTASPSDHVSTDYPNMPTQPDTSDIAINFILALEHQCRTHFHPSSTEPDPIGDPSGHELTVSALLYSHAPTSAFGFSDNASWPIPSVEISQLWQMSQNLTKADWEITPVQAWFLLTGRYNMKELLGDGGAKLTTLKEALGKTMGCCAYGVGMQEAHFWEIVEEIMEGRASNGSVASEGLAPACGFADADSIKQT